ncbi:MAG: site-specific integrase [Planctomycetaceae bacterium]|nr:site-specific integrase [Planctomycetaceae bacterium]
MSKRANGEGTVYKRKDGKWRGRISLGSDANGKRVQRTVYGSTQAEVLEKLDELRRQAKLNRKSVVERDSLAGYLKRWLDNDIAVNREDNTYTDYELAVRRFINPFIGAVTLQKLDGEKLIAWQADLKRQDFSNNQRLRSIRTLRAALNKAVKLQLIANNPCNVLDIPRVERREVIPLEAEQCRILFSRCSSHRIGDVIPLAAMTGLRKGELFGLEWGDIDFDNGMIHVRRALQEIKGRHKIKPTKSRSSRRTVTLEPVATKALLDRRDKAIAEGFTPDLVPTCFTDTRGGFLRNSNFDRNVWYPIREEAGVKIRFHDLRHTQASLMLHAGVDLKVIQERLGHASYATTANMYTHLMKDAQRQAADRLSSLVNPQGKAS